jgi:esterase/lipase
MISASDKYYINEGYNMETPSKLLLSLEATRGIYEYGLSWLLYLPLQFVSPKGDGHPVMVIPGLSGSDGSTHYMRNFLGKVGYNAYSWGFGRNMGPRAGIGVLVDRLCDRVQEISAENNGQAVSLIGWSLGGIYAREIAKEIPDCVRQVITLGTPFKHAESATNAALLYEFLSKDKSHKDPEIVMKLGMAPPVPFTSIFSKSDGVVSWQSSLEKATDISENVEVPGASHLGLGHNPLSMYVIADRLSQPPGNWKPYRTK